MKVRHLITEMITKGYRVYKEEDIPELEIGRDAYLGIEVVMFVGVPLIFIKDFKQRPDKHFKI